MVKEQLLDFAMKAFSRLYNVKERVKNKLTSDDVVNYLESLKSVAIAIVENHRTNTQKESVSPRKKTKATVVKKSAVKIRKSSIKPAKEIGSPRADFVLKSLHDKGYKLVDSSDAIEGKKSLAYLVWALGHAHQAAVAEGISVHDVSALLYRACHIELYPINISRVVYGNPKLVRQISQKKRTKTYLLTEEGQALFNEKFLRN